MSADNKISYLFNPSTIAMVGSLQEGKVAHLFLKSIVEGGFRGKIYPVTTASKEVMGYKCYPAITDIPGNVDMVVIATPMNSVLEVVKSCVEKRVKAAIVIAASSGEGDNGHNLEAEIVKTARQGGLRLAGGNSMGVLCPRSRLNTLMPVLRLSPEAGQVSFVGQSGWVSQNFFLIGRQKGLRFSKVIASGDEMDLTSIDFIEYFAEDPDTKIIGAYVEGVKDGRDFVRRLRASAAKKPVIICKGGRTEAGSRAAASHTRSLAVNFDILSSAIMQSGAIIADGVEELVDSAVGFISPYLPKGNRIGFVVESGGAGTLGVDACGALGLEVPDLPEKVKLELKDNISKVIPMVTTVHNPVDFIWPPYDGRAVRLFPETMKLMADYVDAFLAISYHFSSYATDEVFDNFLHEIEATRKQIQKPIMLIPGYVTDHPERMVQCVRKGIPCFPTPERALKAMSNLWQYYRKHS